jgi:Uma2 family endonuclease
MMTTAARPIPPKAGRIWTYDEVLAELPESNLPMELWDGEIVMSPTPTPSHQTIVKRLTVLLDEFTRHSKAGEIFWGPLDVVLSEHRVVQPDVIFISNENRQIVTDRIRGVPDLVVESFHKEAGGATVWKKSALRASWHTRILDYRSGGAYDQNFCPDQRRLSAPPPRR